RELSGDQARDMAPLGNVRIRSPLSASHIRSVLSAEPLTIFKPSGDQATEDTPATCPVSVRRRVPESASQILIVLSPYGPPTLARRAPSGDQVRAQLKPGSTCSTSLSCIFQITTPTLLAAASLTPLGL